MREKGWDEGYSPQAQTMFATPHPNPRNLQSPLALFGFVPQGERGFP
ncbi:hypothetical protein [Azospirillum doebereinerae]